MSARRMERVNELVKRCLADAWLRRAAGDTTLTAATITRVECTPDLRQARVFISVLAEAGGRVEDLLPAFYEHRKWLQHEVATHARLKYTPHLRFVKDTAVERGDRILAILAELAPERETTFKETPVIEERQPERSTSDKHHESQQPEFFDVRR